MGSRKIKHGKHEHNLKTVNEDVSGILMDDRGTDKVSETFGWDYEKFELCLRKMLAFAEFQNAADKLYIDEDDSENSLPRSTKTSMFADFIKSGTFKEMGIKLVTPNDYLMIGFIFCATITTEGLSDVIDKLSGRKDPEKFLELLTEFRKAVGDRS